MLIPLQHEKHHGEKEPHDLAGHILGCKGHPHGDAHQEIAQDPFDERIRKGKGTFGSRRGKIRHGQLRRKQRQLMSAHAQSGDKGTADKITAPYHHPVGEHLPHGDLLFHKRYGK